MHAHATQCSNPKMLPQTNLRNRAKSSTLGFWTILSGVCAPDARLKQNAQVQLKK